MEFVEIEHEHAKWLWAAYKMGAFPDLLQDISETDFAWEIGPVLETYDFATIAKAKKPGRDGLTPVGIFLVSLVGAHAEPHVIWFPWATPRNKLELVIKFLIALNKDYTTIVNSKEENKRFFEHLCKYGILRRIGIAYKFFEDGQKAHLFQTRTL